MADKRPRTKLCHLLFYDVQIIYQQDMKSNQVRAKLHTGGNPAPRVVWGTEICWDSIHLTSKLHYVEVLKVFPIAEKCLFPPTFIHKSNC